MKDLIISYLIHFGVWFLFITLLTVNMRIPDREWRRNSSIVAGVLSLCTFGISQMFF